MPQELNNEEILRNRLDVEFIKFCFGDLSNKTNESIISYYLQDGWKNGVDPNSKFSNRLYLMENADVSAAGIDPYKHYIDYGAQEGRNAYLSQWGDITTNKITSNQIEIISNEFDYLYYKLHVPEISALSNESLVSHYLVIGWKQGLDPSPSFSTKFYLDNHPDVSEAGINPFVHFILHRDTEYRISSNPSDEDLQADIQAIKDYFNADYYRLSYPDIKGSNIQLVEHYLKIGWKELRDPSPNFSTSYYLENYPDILANGSNPLLHYVVFGKSEGRRPRGDEPLQLIYNPSSSITPGHLYSVVNSVLHSSNKITCPISINPSNLVLHWVIPDFSQGSGGHMTIFRMVSLLELFGHTCKIWIENPVFNKSAEGAWENIIKYFQCVRAPVDFVSNGFYEATGDAVIATGWSTAYCVENSKGFTEKFYFVQDHEPEFYPSGSEYLLAKKTYDFNLSCICASPWLSKLMKEEYGRWARSFDLAYDPSIYKILDNNNSGKLGSSNSKTMKVAVYSRDHTARRCVPLVLMALEQLGNRRDDFEVHFFGQDALSFNETNFRAVNHGVLDSVQLSELYNNCHIGICFSATNYSLVPQEMMACGLPLIELNSKSTNEIFSSDIVTFAGPDPFDISNKISDLLDNDEKRLTQSEAALTWVSQFSWDKSARAVERALMERLGISITPLKNPSIVTSKNILLDVIIPTYNGITEIEYVIDSLRQQKSYDNIQIHCIDSTSSDGTLEWLKLQRDVSLTIIPQENFQHGRTRNLGAEQGKAKLISYLTQDAIPANDTWATNIIKMFDHCENAAGLFGKHIPYPHHPLVVRKEIENHFLGMINYPLQLSKYTDPLKWESDDQGWRMLLHFYSDNNSAMRRAVWEEIPYQDVDYGEDQLWARDIIEKGYTKIYAPSVCVFHSHDYSPADTYKRSKIEADFFHKYFGYELGYGSIEDLEAGVEAEQKNFMNWAKKNKINQTDMDKGLENIKQKNLGLRDGRLRSKDK